MDNVWPVSNCPLAGKRVLVTRAEEQSGTLVEQLRSLGAEAIVCPLIAFLPPGDGAPLRAALARLSEYHWLLLTSANAVRAIFTHIATPLPAGLKVGVVGPATAQALAEHDVAPSFVPSVYTAEAMAAELADPRGARVLLPTSDLARDTLAAGLRARGAHVDVVTAYRTVPGSGAEQLVACLCGGEVDAITFASPSSVRAMLHALAARDITDPSTLLGRVARVAIGPTTAAALREAGLSAICATEHTAAGMVAALVEDVSPSSPKRLNP